MKKSSFLQLLVGYHKPAVLLDNEICTPMQTGRAQYEEEADPRDAAWMREHMLGDDTGDNISRFGRQFSEVALYYWAWKNYAAIGNPEYFGVMQYRRHFLFGPYTGSPHSVKSIGNHEFIDDAYLAEANLTEAGARAALAGIGAVFAPPFMAPRFGERPRGRSNLDMLAGCAVNVNPRCSREDILRAVRARTPRHMDAVEAYLDDDIISYHGMFIMRRDVFFRYAAWLFGILGDDRLGFMDEAAPQKRFGGHIVEYLTGAFAALLRAEGKEKVRLLRHSNIRLTGLTDCLFPVSRVPSLPVVVFLDDESLPYFQVFLRMLGEAAPSGLTLDILAVDAGLSNPVKRALQPEKGGTIAFRSFEVDHLIGDRSEFLRHGYGAAEMHAALHLPALLKNFNRIVLADIDTLVLGGVDAMRAILENSLGDKPAAFFPPEKGSARGLGKAFGTGMMFLNLDRLRQSDFTARCLAGLGAGRSVGDVAKTALKILREDGSLVLGPEWDASTPARPGEKRFLAGGQDGLRPWHRPAGAFPPEFWRHAARVPLYRDIRAALPAAEKAAVPTVREKTNALTAAEAQNAKIFAPYRDAHVGCEMVFAASGPSLVRYRPLPGALHLGVNGVAMAEGIGLDYFMATAHYTMGVGGQTSLFNPNMFDTLARHWGKAKAFCLLPGDDLFRFLYQAVATQAASRHGMEVVFLRTRMHEAARGCPRFAHELERELFGAGGAGNVMAFFAMQFALYTRPKRIYLVGCDSTAIGDDTEDKDALGRLTADWLELRDFARRHYPDTEIVSVNPVRLRGIFRDVEM